MSNLAPTTKDETSAGSSPKIKRHAFDRAGCRSFLFALESPLILAVMRICLSSLIFFDFLPVQPFLVEFFSSAGQPLPLHPDGWFQTPVLSPSHTALL